MKLLGVWCEGAEYCNELKYMLSHSNIKCSTKLNMDIRYSFSIYVMFTVDCFWFGGISSSLFD